MDICLGSASTSNQHDNGYAVVSITINITFVIIIIVAVTTTNITRVRLSTPSAADVPLQTVGQQATPACMLDPHRHAPYMPTVPFSPPALTRHWRPTYPWQATTL